MAIAVIGLAACGEAANDQPVGPKVNISGDSSKVSAVTFNAADYPEPGDLCPDFAAGNRSVRKNDLDVEHMMTCLQDDAGSFRWTA